MVSKARFAVDSEDVVEAHSENCARLTMGTEVCHCDTPRTPETPTPSDTTP